MTDRGDAGAPWPGRAILSRVAAGARPRAPILEALARHATVGIFLSDAAGSVYYFNRAACRIIGLPRARALGRGWLEAMGPDDRVRAARNRDRALARGAVYRARLRFVHGNGDMVQADVVSVPVRDRGQVRVRVGMLVEAVERVAPAGADSPAAGGRRWDDLSPQERRVLQLVVEGRTNKEIAATLGLSHKTVKNYLSSAFQKLQVERRSHAAAVFARRSSDH